MKPTPNRALRRTAAVLAAAIGTLLAPGLASAARIFLCRGAAQGMTPAMFWSAQPCAVHQAQTLQAALAPDSLSFEDQVRWVEQSGANAAPAPAPAPTPLPAPLPPAPVAPAPAPQAAPLFAGLSPACRTLAERHAVLSLRERQAPTPQAREAFRPQRVALASEMLRLGCRP